MKNFLIVILFTFASASFGTVTVYDKMEKWNFEYSAELDFNSELERAWVVVNLIEDDGEDSWYNEVKVKVSGLNYNTENKQILFNNTVCANVVTRGGWIFKREVIKMTEACNFKTVFYKKLVDDGFEIKKYNFVKIDLIIN